MLVLFVFNVFETFLFPSNPSLHGYFNPAHLAEKKWQASLGGNERFGMAELRTWNLNAQASNYGLGFRSFGSDLYRENSLELGYGFPVGKNFSAGLNISAFYCWVRDHESIYTYAVRAGGAFATARTAAGIWIGNINMPRFSETDFLPITYAAHALFRAARQFSLFIAAMGMQEHMPFFDVGIIMAPAGSIRVLAGLNTENFIFEYGLELGLGKFKLNYSGNNHRQLGLSHEFSLVFGK
jgi:hypothetical protein